MARTIQLVPGLRYWAGADLPWFVPESVVTSALRDIGFDAPQWHERSESPPVDPHSDPAYLDDWSSWATAIYTGQAKPYELPNGLKWIVAEQRATQPAPTPPNDAGPTQSTATTPDPNVVLGQNLLRLIDEALKSNDPKKMRMTAEYFATRNMPELARTLNDAAADRERERAKTIALVAVGIGTVTALTLGVVIALRSAK